ncbi:hypothetical protein N0V88_000652 [Collariella sp. IMI 366227]|nr:hypothetical protein N0V88_000652 [Collariella sp. IMI 366227]
MAEKVVSLIQAVMGQLKTPDIQSFLAVYEENNSLRNKNQILEADIESQCRQTASFQAKLDRVEKLHNDTASELLRVGNEKDDLTVMLKEAQRKIEEKQKALASRETELAKEVEDLKKRLGFEQERLEELEEYSVGLKPVSANLNEITSRLGKLFLSARNLAETYFGIDLDPKTVLNGALWGNIKNHPAVKSIPIPIDNTNVAKQMRTSAFLSILAHEMKHHIFQPVYLLRNAAGLNELNEVVNKLVNEDSEHEAHIRSVLLRLAKWTADEDNKVVKSHIHAVVKNVSDAVIDLLPDDKTKDTFQSNLHTFCEETCSHWSFIQHLDSKLDLDFSFEEEEPTFWKPLFPIPQPTSLPTPTKLKTNGTIPTISGKKPPPPQPQPQHPHEPLADALVIWPAIYNRSSPDLETLVPGYMVTALNWRPASSRKRHSSLRDRGGIRE